MDGSSSRNPRSNSPPKLNLGPPCSLGAAEECFSFFKDHREQDRYNVVSTSPQPSAALCFPGGHSPDIQDFDMGDPYPPTRRLPSLDFIPTNEGPLLGDIHTRIAALRTSSTDTQNRCSQTVNASISVEPSVEPNWNRNVRMFVTNALWNSTAFFAEGETASQLLRYREMFAFLSQCHAEALASNSLDMAQDLIRRGQISIAVIRITGHRTQSFYNNSVAHGCLARNSSEVSIWGWKPWREMAMADKISERRRKRAATEQEKIRGKSMRRTRFCSDTCGDDEIRSLGGIPAHARNQPDDERSWAGVGLDLCAENADYFDDRNTYISHSSICRDNSNDTSSNSSKSDMGSEGSTGISSPDLVGDYLTEGEGPSTDGAREHESGLDILEDQDAPAGWKWPPRIEPEIQWHLPVYDEVKPNNSALPKNDGDDPDLRVHVINEPSRMGYLRPPSPELRLTPQISPKSVSLYVSSTSGNETYESSLPDISTSVSLDSPVSFDKIVFELRSKKPPTSTDSNSDSTVGGSRARNHLRKMKTAFRSIPLTKIHFPWSSSDEEGGAGAVGLGEVQTASTDSSFATGSEQSWPPAGSIPPGYGLVPPPPPPREFMPYVESTTPETRIHSPHPRQIGTSHSPPHPGIRVSSIDTSVSGFTIWRGMPITRHRESDPLTRTEKEYQELLTILNELKRELRMRRRRKRGKKSKGEE